MRIFVMVPYLGIGALLHWIILGTTFNVASVASWAVLLGWPMILSIAMFLIGIVILIAVVLIIAIVDLFTSWSRRRRRAKRLANY